MCITVPLLPVVCQFVSYTITICIVNAKNTNILASVTSGSGDGLSSSVFVIVVVAVRFYLQQSDNFCKIQKENTKWTGAIFMCDASLSFFPLGPSVYTLTGILLEALDRQYC
jgi:hypothetical protein